MTRISSQSMWFLIGKNNTRGWPLRELAKNGQKTKNRMKKYKRKKFLTQIKNNYCKRKTFILRNQQTVKRVLMNWGTYSLRFHNVWYSSSTRVNLTWRFSNSLRISNPKRGDSALIFYSEKVWASRNHKKWTPDFWDIATNCFFRHVWKERASMTRRLSASFLIETSSIHLRRPRIKIQSINLPSLRILSLTVKCCCRLNRIILIKTSRSDKLGWNLLLLNW